LKAATAEAVRATPEGDCESFAARTRVSARTLRLYCDHSSDLFAPLDVIADLEAATSDPIIARVLADLSGCVLAKKPSDPTLAALAAIRDTASATALIAGLVDDSNSPGPGVRPWGREAAKATLRDVRKAQAALAGLEQILKTQVERD
jgi:hypothetical protein